MGPRQYSIASSEDASPEEVHVLVKHVEYNYRGRQHGGVCSSQLAVAETGDTLGVSFKDNASFKLPTNDETKVIMIGAGTGVAPFRSFLFDRDAKGIEGNTWLFFGEQRFRTDFLYQTEWQQHLKSGVLEKMTVAFSRDQEEKIYVQNRILEQAEGVYQWLESGAHIYICGDMHRMAKDVHEALIEVVEKQSGRSADEASAWLDQLVADKRYQRDVY
jgi:sulfite reductase (NADPH) flavoprotein alpha-component